MRGAVRSARRRVHGVLLLDKPSGITSNAALRAAQRLYGADKGGHTGTLDPLATGLLPLCFGDAARFASALLDAEKAYSARVRLGTTTTTGDLEGAVTGRARVEVTRADVEAVLARFVGEIQQVPPMYSAIKQDGRPLYEIAREGREVPREPRRVVIGRLTAGELSADEIELDIACSKGTYIRVLAEDIGRALGCGACLAALRRTRVGRFQLGYGTVALGTLETMSGAERAAALLPADALAEALPRLDLDTRQAQRLAQGQAVESAGAVGPGVMRVYGPGPRFLGLAEVTGPGRIVPRRLVSEPAGT